MKQDLLVFALTGISIAACADQALDLPDVAVAEQAVITPCPFLDPADPLFYGGPPVDYARELVINSVRVVDDPCRTSWTGSCAGGGTQGIWTFRELMTRIAGTVAPEKLVAEWLHQWEVPIVVNGFPIPPRLGIQPLVINPWLAASGCPAGATLVGPGACPLDLKRAPFRLLAITNRADLDCSGGGEARLVFGFLDGAGNPLQAAVIFEFKLPPQRGGLPYNAVRWENDWHVLSSLAIGSSTYMAKLEALINDITAVGALPGGPNLGTSIGQVRTNEISFGGFPWKLRETRLQNTGGGPNAMLLLATTTADTPHDSLNQTPAPAGLDAHLNANALALINFLQTPPPPGMLGGETSAPLPGPSPFWDHTAPTPLAPIARHHFGLSTCNGCHLQETNTPFLHIGNRVPGMPAPLSPFLATSPAPGGGGFPATAQLVNDPAPTGAVFKYNEPWRRVCEASRMLQGTVATCWSRANGAH